MESDKSLSQNINELMRSRGFDISKLAEATGVSDRYIAFFLEGKYSKLPAAPYARGYLYRIAAVLETNPENLYETYLAENAGPRRAGKEDKMPENRFLTKNQISKTILIFLALVAIAVLGILRSVYLRSPKVEFLNLKEDITISKEAKFIVKGVADPSYKLTLNNVEIILDKNGAFEKEILLESGFNTFTFKTKKVLGREHKIVKQIFYEEPEIKNDIIFEPQPQYVPEENQGF